jgi:endogenous inhibitor of DNA gyrase (YacG/DUF329 family)
MVARSRHVCPICGKESRPRAENASYPFCCPPCKLVDLGSWLDGAYRIPGPDLSMEGDVDIEGADEAGSSPRRREEDS